MKFIRLIIILAVSFIYTDPVLAMLINPPQEDEMTPDGYIMFAYEKDLNIGYIKYHQKSYQLWKISLLSVISAYRKCGVGTNLLSNCFAHIVSMGGKKIVLDIMPLEPQCVDFEQLLNFYSKNFTKLAPLADKNLQIFVVDAAPELTNGLLSITLND